MPIGKVRSAIRALTPYRPGKSAAQAEQEHGIADAIKLASNENPFAPLPSVIEAVAEAAGTANRYADHRATALRHRLADWIGVIPEQVTVGCGSVGLLQQLCLTYVDPGDEVVFPWLSFEAYPVYTRMMDGVAVSPPLVDHAFDMEAIAAAVNQNTKLVMLATPNNPTGTAVSTARIKELLETIPSNVVVLVDEAYREFADPALGDPVTDLLPHHQNVVITRTFSKAYGLAGLRVGYAITNPEIITEMDKILLAFAVNGAAQAAALATLDAIDEYQPRIRTLLDERTRVVAALTAAGHTLPDAQANFVYVPLGDRTEKVCLGLEQRGVVTRPFPGDGIRVTIGTPAENDRFLAALGDTLDTGID
ncbi:MAG: histidinol-phosphate transaminase [Acidimicrobiia bacterium]|nr:histidinol-phosphate transaminase [Acidimicrobiia bacterium]MDH5519483.1 histidinol-phosphate transaminase [Acidimicrobiia bacterium]